MASNQFQTSYVKVKPSGQAQGLWILNDDHKIGKISRDDDGSTDQGHGREDLCTSLRVFLRFGRVLGILPVGGLFSWNSRTEGLKVTRFGVAYFSNKLVSLMLVFNVFIGVVNMFLSTKETATGLARSLSMAFFYMMGAFTFIYIGLHGQEFVKLLMSWKKMKPLHFASHSSHNVDVNLFRDTNLAAGLIFTSAILENTLLFCLQSEVIWIPNDDDRTVITYPKMDAYYRNSHIEWVRFVYDKSGTTTAVCLGYFVWICNKLAVCAWNYADAIVIVLSRALYFKFKALNEAAEQQLLKPRPPSKSTGGKLNEDEDDEGSAWEWTQLTIDHSIICELLAEFASFLSPLIFISFATNIFFICLQIKLGLTSMSRANFVSSLYFVWSLLHLLIRTFLVCLSAARINEHAHGLRKVYQACPESAYSLAVQRADHYLGSTSLGLHGLRCFVITKPLILTVIGVVFTFEIVLLTTN